MNFLRLGAAWVLCFAEVLTFTARKKLRQMLGFTAATVPVVPPEAKLSFSVDNTVVHQWLCSRFDQYAGPFPPHVWIHVQRDTPRAYGICSLCASLISTHSPERLVDVLTVLAHVPSSQGDVFSDVVETILYRI